MTGFAGTEVAEWNSERLVRHFGARAFANGAAAWVKDGIHDMAVVLKHDGHRIVAVRGKTHGFPWSTCPSAIGQLDAFVGASIDDPIRPPSVDQHAQCTHLLDLARFAMTQIGRGGRLHYRLSVDRLSDDPQDIFDARVQRNGEDIIRWTVEDYKVSVPADLAGHSVDGRAILPDHYKQDSDRLEAVMMLRRAIKMFRGRDRASRMPQDIAAVDRRWMIGACYTFQDGVVEDAERTTPWQRIIR